MPPMLFTAPTPFTAATPAASAPTPGVSMRHDDQFGGFGLTSQTPAELPATPWGGPIDGPFDDGPNEGTCGPT